MLPSDTQGEYLGGFRGSTIQKSGKVAYTAGTICTKCSTRLHIHLEKRPLKPRWGHFVCLFGQKFKSVKGGQTVGPIGTKFGIRMVIGLGMDIYAKKSAP